MLAAQNGVCAICRRPEVRRFTSHGEVSALAVDHDHETGKIRSLLCTKCNTAMGMLNDDPVLMRAAAEYIERHRQ